MLWIKTISNTEEVAAALKSAKATDLPVAATKIFDTAAMQQALGQLWTDIPENLGDAVCRKSWRSRRK